MEFLTETELDSAVVVGDEKLTKELLYLAINNEYDIDTITLNNSYEYDKGYLTTIMWNGDNYEITVEEAFGDTKFLACGSPTFVQHDFEWKCEYINDVSENKFVQADLTIVIVGDLCCEDDDGDEDRVYTYANEYSEDGVYGQIYVASTLKDFVDVAKSSFEDVFLD